MLSESRPCVWIKTRLLCCELGKKNYKRRTAVTLDNAEKQDVEKKEMELFRNDSTEFQIGKSIMHQIQCRKNDKITAKQKHRGNK